MRWIWLGVGVIAVIVGAIWTLQGVNVMGGSAMSGHAIFALLGVLVGIGGLVLIAISTRRVRTHST